MSGPEPSPLRNSALADEIEAINSIYGSESITLISPFNDEDAIIHAVLQLPEQPFSFSVTFPAEYPAHTPPHITGTQTTSTSSKGAGTAALQILRDLVARVWTPGQVCLFDVIEEAGPLLLIDQDHHRDHGEIKIGTETTGEDADAEHYRSADPTSAGESAEHNANTLAGNNVPGHVLPQTPPPSWTLSEPLADRKSIFIARCCPISSKSNAAASLTHLLSTNKKVASATHNITAWRVQGAADNGVVQQDCDDDGENAAGGRLLHLLQLMDVWNCLVVVTRWYGGVQLGADRFKHINTVAREALVRGGFVKGHEEKEKGGGGGGKRKGKR